MNVRNILIIGRTGSGKSALANLISGTTLFIESANSVSKTKNIQIEVFPINDDTKFRLIDTVGIGDTGFTEDEVLYKLAEAVYAIRNGLNQIFFVVGGRFTKEEIEAYNLLKSVFFDEKIDKYITIVRTKFPDFNNIVKCDEDTALMFNENLELSNLLEKCNGVIHVNNLKYPEETSQKSRERLREKLLDYLITYQGTYKPNNLDELNKMISGNLFVCQKNRGKEKDLSKQIADYSRGIEDTAADNNELIANLISILESIEKEREIIRKEISDHEKEVAKKTKEFISWKQTINEAAKGIT
ncbi:17254_t:CDS:2 [Cetraspora pellucida]|uniref:17254_t:CDS:1 n=1 Tax=Cetraspora pellucida TaxID=1433469 RepID=A0ACA9KJB9_9GLOM|nr:17254_t:CDS:2 [Cetraspora pellucida]